MKRFELGQIVVTQTISECESNNIKFAEFVIDCLCRHSTCDWGDLCEEDKMQNEIALRKGYRLFSSYDIPKEIGEYYDSNIYIITEWDSSVTTILFPSEY